jgi:hypothetical protein
MRDETQVIRDRPAAGWKKYGPPAEDPEETLAFLTRGELAMVAEVAKASTWKKRRRVWQWVGKFLLIVLLCVWVVALVVVLASLEGP